MTRPNRIPTLLLLPIIGILLAAISASAQSYADGAQLAGVHERTNDTTLRQAYTGHFGWTLHLPEEEIAKFNKLGSKVNAAGLSEVVNFMLRGGRGGVTIRYYTEKRIVPTGYMLLDSAIHYHETDSVGRNGTIYRRSYILRDQAIDIEILLTDKGHADLGGSITGIFDSFLPPESAAFELEEWRYGRDASEYEEGRYDGPNAPDRE